MLALDRVSFRYGPKTVLSDVNLHLGRGVNVLLGRNGAGKTTLMRIVAGVALPAVGEVRLDGKVLGRRARSRRRSLRRIGWLPQTFGYPPSITVRQFVTYAAWLKEVPRYEIADRVDQLLDVIHLSEKAAQPLRALSGGQLRRVGLAAAMVAGPDILILDEPTAGLDPEQRDSFHALIRQSRTQAVVVVATHLLEDVDAVGEKIVILDRGTVCWTGGKGELTELGGATGLDGLRKGFQAVIGQGG